MVALLIPVVLAVAASSAYAAYRSVELRKFLAGAFFVLGGVAFYFGFVRRPAAS